MVSSRSYSHLIVLLLGMCITAGCGMTNETPPTPTVLPAPTITSPDFQEGLNISAWFQLYGKNKESSAGDVLITQDGGFLVVGGIGQFQESESIGGVMLIRTDPQGKIFWQEIYGGDGFEFGASAIESLDEGYLIIGETTSFEAAGSDGYILKVDEDGQLLWSRTIGGKLNETLNTILSVPENGYFLVGNTVDPNDFITNPGVAGYGGFAGRSNVYVTMLDTTGEQIWSKVIESDSNMIASEAVLSVEGDLYVLASLIKFPEPGDDLVLYKFDPSGELLWTRIWEEGDLGGRAITRDREGNLVITGISSPETDGPSDLFILKTDPDGFEMFFTLYGTPGLYESGRDIIVMSDGNYVVLTDSHQDLFSGVSSSGLLSVDFNGAQLWESRIDLPYSIKGATFKPHPQGGFVITGAVFSQNGEFSTILVRTDSSGATE